MHSLNLLTKVIPPMNLCLVGCLVWMDPVRLGWLVEEEGVELELWSCIKERNYCGQDVDSRSAPSTAILLR